MKYKKIYFSIHVISADEFSICAKDDKRSEEIFKTSQQRLMKIELALIYGMSDLWIKIFKKIPIIV